MDKSVRMIQVPNNSMFRGTGDWVDFSEFTKEYAKEVKITEDEYWEELQIDKYLPTKIKIIRLMAVIVGKNNDRMVMPSSIPINIGDGFPCVIIQKNGVSLTTGDLNYWAKQKGAIPVYEDEEVTFKFGN